MFAKLSLIFLTLTTVLFSDTIEIIPQYLDIDDCKRCKAYITNSKAYANLPLVINTLDNIAYKENLYNSIDEYNKYSNFFAITETSIKPKWGNGSNDFHGVISLEEASKQFNTNIPSTTVAFNARRLNDNGEVIETDIVILPTYELVDDNKANGNGNVFGKNLTIMHELGHALGLDHNFFYYSVMNYPQSQFEYNWTLKKADLEMLQRKYSLYNFYDTSINFSYSIGYRAYSSCPVYFNDGEFLIQKLNVSFLDNSDKDITIDWFLSNKFMGEELIYLNTTSYNKSSDVRFDSMSYFKKDSYHLVAKINEPDDNLNNNTAWYQGSFIIDYEEVISDDENINVSESPSLTTIEENIHITGINSSNDGGGGCLLQ